MVGGCGPNVVDGPVPWREVPGGGRAGAGKEAEETHDAEYFPKLSLHRRGSSRIVLLRTGA